jgi:hypothetical protein
MKRIVLFVLLLAVGVVVAASNSFAQDGIVSIDTVKNSVYGDGRIQEGVNPRILIRFNNTTGERCNISNGWKLTSPDGAQWDSLTVDSVGGVNVDGENLFFAYFNQVIAVQGIPSNRPGNGPPADTFGILGAGSPTSASRQMPIGFDDTVLAVIIWQTPGAVNHNKHFCIDSALAQDGLWTWKWVTRTLIDRFPTYIGLNGQTYDPNGIDADRIGSGYCFEVKDPAVGVDDVVGSLPREFSVSQNYPNPFNPTTTIDYSVPRKSQVNLAVYNVLGQKVATLVDQEMAAGKYRAVWDGKAESGNPLSSGIYFYKFEADNFVKTNKMVMLK